MTNETFYRIIVGILGIALLSTGLYMSSGSDSQKPAEKPPGVMIEGVLKQPDELLCHSKPYTDDELNYAAMYLISPMIDPVPEEQAEVPAALARVSKTRAFAMTVQNARIKDAYLGWVKYYEDKITEKQRLFSNHTNQTESDDAYWDKIHKKIMRAHELEECLPKPGGKP